MSIRLSKSEAARLGLKPARAPRSPIDHRDYKSGLERRYAEFLESRKITGGIVDWRYEPIKLHLGGGAWFTTDFLVIGAIHENPSGGKFVNERPEFHEVKGHWREAAKVRMKVAVEKYPWFAFYVVTADGKGFNVERWSK